MYFKQSWMQWRLLTNNECKNNTNKIFNSYWLASYMHTLNNKINIATTVWSPYMSQFSFSPDDSVFTCLVSNTRAICNTACDHKLICNGTIMITMPLKVLSYLIQQIYNSGMLVAVYAEHVHTQLTISMTTHKSLQ